MPAAIPLEDHKQQVNVRFDVTTREALEAYALASDRTISQLVRYATSWWLSEGSHACPVPGVGEGAGPGRHVNVRFSPPVIVAINKAAETMTLDRSAVIRCAVRAWLDTVTPEALGHPSIAVRPSPQAEPTGIAV